MPPKPAAKPKGRRPKDEPKEEEFSIPTTMVVKPDDQLQLTEKEMAEEITRCVL
jgi:hypothetical protein